MIRFRAEFHVHTVLSPDAGIEMVPPVIIKTALEKGINLIGITDHNSTYNAAAVMEAASGTALTVLPGIELETAEGVHCICLFDTLDQLAELQKIVDMSLPDNKNDVDFYGHQLVVDAQGNYIRTEDRLLLTSTSLTIGAACRTVRSLGGLFFPAHVERQRNGIISHLGTIPTNLQLKIAEISRFHSKEECIQKYPILAGFHILRSGDVHYPDAFWEGNCFSAQDTSIRAIEQGILASL